ncbi:uncharacterized protein LOC107268244 [Cephus cinctus]|uniref:Uncharacterized protein LOC107268244 n=1 Tax=Cephus cinctus TaxID=211228 RepID=A0AAJ7FKI1_CEPCN|nr:uncharacterized protein LOC107268244 [Cephus cinctus]
MSVQRVTGRRPKDEITSCAVKATKTAKMTDGIEEAITEVDTFEVEELRERLERLGRSIKGTKPVLADRLPNDDEDDEEGDDVPGKGEASSEEEEEEELDVKTLRTAALKEELRKRSSKVTGKKSELRARLQRALDQEATSTEETTTDDSEDEEVEITLQRGKKNADKKIKSLMSLKEAQKSLPVFTGDKGENIQRWLLTFETIAKIAGQADIEEEAIIQYSIDGIRDDEVNKTILYGASSIKEFRKKLQLYETQKENSGKSHRSIQRPSNNDKPKRIAVDKMTDRKDGVIVKPKHCFVCGNKNHLSRDCPDKEKGRKCFKCDRFGHISSEYTTEVKKSSSTNTESRARVDAVEATKRKIPKDIKMLGQDVTACIDSGSDLHLVRFSEYQRLGAPKLELKKIVFDGANSKDNKTIGRFTTEIEIDEMKFDFVFHVVPDEYIPYNVIVGVELTDLAEVRLRHRAAKVVSLEEKEMKEIVVQIDDPGWQTVLSINAQVEPEPEVSTRHIADPKIREEVKEIVENYEPRKTKETEVKINIILNDEVPVFQNPRRLSADQRKIVNEIVDEWLQRGIVRHSTSNYASPIVLVAKKNNQWRLCVDYRMLNRKILRDRNPLPLIEDQLDRLQDARVFCTLDMKDGFFHVPIEESSIKYTAFVTPDGQFEFLRVLFGLCNSPAVFQRFVRAVFQRLINDGTVLAYLDDLIIPAKTEAECCEKLKKVLKQAEMYGLIINWKKCEQLVRRVQYLGYIVEEGEIRPSDEKTKAVKNFPKPKSVKQIQSFLGLTGYFRKFIPDYARIARPLSNLLRNSVKFHCGPLHFQVGAFLSTTMK